MAGQCRSGLVGPLPLRRRLGLGGGRRNEEAVEAHAFGPGANFALAMFDDEQLVSRDGPPGSLPQTLLPRPLEIP
jgi:hypothetical protein